MMFHVKELDEGSCFPQDPADKSPTPVGLWKIQPFSTPLPQAPAAPAPGEPGGSTWRFAYEAMSGIDALFRMAAADPLVLWVFRGCLCFV